MGNLTLDDMRQMAGPMGLTEDEIAHPVRLEAVGAQCNRCGTCCKTQNGILVSLYDVYRIAARLEVAPEDFVWKRCRASRAYDVFGRGPYRGISLETRDGICPFYQSRAGCSINDVKPLVCQLYPFNTLHVTRACLLKMQRMKDDERYGGCYLFDLPDGAVIIPDFAALARYHAHMYATQDYCSRAGGKWHDDLAREAKDEGVRLAGDRQFVEALACRMREAFEALDRRNAEMLAEAMNI